MSIKLTQSGVYYKNGAFVPEQDGPAAGLPVPRQPSRAPWPTAFSKPTIPMTTWRT